MKFIPGLENRYSATKDGRIYSHIRGIYLKPKKAGGKNKEYHAVDINRKSMKIHRLIALTYLENPEKKPEINHIDGNRFNNSLDNLEWCTRSENILHASRTGLWENQKLKVFELNMTKRKLTTFDANCIRYMMENKLVRNRDLAELYNVTRGTITHIYKGNRYNC